MELLVFYRINQKISGILQEVAFEGDILRIEDDQGQIQIYTYPKLNDYVLRGVLMVIIEESKQVSLPSQTEFQELQEIINFYLSKP